MIQIPEEDRKDILVAFLECENTMLRYRTIEAEAKLRQEELSATMERVRLKHDIPLAAKIDPRTGRVQVPLGDSQNANAVATNDRYNGEKKDDLSRRVVHSQ